MSLEDDIRRGESAARILGDETMLEAFASVLAEAKDAWADSAPQNQQLRDDAYTCIRAIRLLRIKLDTWKGQMVSAKAKIEDEKRRSQGVTPHV